MFQEDTNSLESESVTCPVVSYSLHPHVAHQAPLSMGFPGENTGVGCSCSPGDLPDLGIELGSPALKADSLPSEPPGCCF